MAWVEKRGAKYLARYRGPDGKHHSQAFDKKRDAVEHGREMERQVRAMTWTDPRRAKITVGEWAKHWIGTLSVKPKTLDGYESLLRSVILPRWADVRLDQVTLTEIRKWLAGMEGVSGRLLSPSRRRGAYRVLSALLDAAVEDGRLPRNPARPATGRAAFLPKGGKQKLHRFLTHDELHRLAEAVEPHYRAFVLVLGYTGLRWGEATALRVRNVDMLRGRISVEGAVSEVHGELIYGTTKTHATRQVSVPGFLREDLARLMEGKGRDDLLFTTPAGAPLRSQNFSRRVFQPAVARAGLERLTPHDLRHTAASLAIASGATVKAVQRMLGHSSAAMTLDVYSGLFDDELDGVADRLNEAVLARSAHPGPTNGLAGLAVLGHREDAHTG